MECNSKSKTHVLEQIYVHDVYNRLGSLTLTQDTTTWPKVRKFLNQISLKYPHALVADIGCGTGKYVQLQSDRYTIGCDRSRQICEIAREKHCQIPIVIADNLHLPYRDNLFDAVLSIGVIHHLATHERRVQAIRECLRILKPNGGQLLIYTWALEQKQRHFSSQDVLVPCIDHPPEKDVHLDNNHSWPTSLEHVEKHHHRLEQENSPPTTFSMIDSLQNLFQRILKPTTSSSVSTPSTPKFSHHDPTHFRIRPFPMSSYEHEDTTHSNPCNKRFYHVFKHGELELLIEEASKTIVGSHIIKSYYDHGNWCAIVEKKTVIDLLRKE